MFSKNGILYRSSVLDLPGVAHGFSVREGGVSTIPHLASLNLTRGLGDSEDNVRQNIDIFAKAVSDGALGGEAAVCAHQIHSRKVRVIGRSNAGEGYSVPCGEDCDGFVTDEVGVMPIVRTADCVPILLCGAKTDGSPVIGAVHAGWRGTAAGIAAVAVEKMAELGCLKDRICVAIGAHIRPCCYEVDDPFYEAVAACQSADFAARYIIPSAEAGKYQADLAGMNMEILALAGVRAEQIDVSPYCTACDPVTFFSHRGGKGKRGTMGAGIVILT